MIGLRAVTETPDDSNMTTYVIGGVVGSVTFAIIMIIVIICVRKCLNRETSVRPPEGSSIPETPAEPYYTADQFEYKGTIYLKKDWDLKKIADQASIEADQAPQSARVQHTTGRGNVVYEIGCEFEAPKSQKTQMSTVVKVEKKDEAEQENLGKSEEEKTQKSEEKGTKSKANKKGMTK